MLLENQPHCIVGLLVHGLMRETLMMPHNRRSMTEMPRKNPLLQVEKEKVGTKKINIVTLHSSDSDRDLSEEVPGKQKSLKVHCVNTP